MWYVCDVQYAVVMSWARVRRVRRGSISSELLMCGVFLALEC